MNVSTPVRAAGRSPDRARRFFAPDNRGLVLSLILVAQLMVVLDATVVNVVLHDIQRALRFSDTGLSWVVNAYTLSFGGLLLLGARTGDLLGRRSVFRGGIAVFTLGSLAAGLATGPGELLLARAVQGAGAAFAAPSALALLMAMFPEARERTRAIGLYTAVSVGGAAVGLIAGGMLAEWASWRWVFFVNVPIGLALVTLSRVLLLETPRRAGHFDVAGALTSTLGMGALVYGFVSAAGNGWSSSTTIAAFAVGLVLLEAFGLVEARTSAPITPLRLFADRNRASAYLARLLLVAGMMGTFYFLTQSLRGVQGYSDLRTGLAFLPLTVAVFAASQLSARRFVERFGSKAVLVAGVTLSTAGMLLLTRIDASSGYLALAVPLVIFGTGNGLAFVPLTTTALDRVAPEDSGAASGLVNVMQQVGGALGLSVLVTVFGTVSAHTAHRLAGHLPAADLAREAFVDGAHSAIWMAAAFLVATWLLVVFAVRRHPTPGADSPGTGDSGRVDAEYAEMLSGAD